MKKYILSAILIALLVGCTEEDHETVPESNDGLVKINVITPSVVTRSTTEPMPENSTIRLFVYKQDTWGTATPTLVDERTYRVTGNGGTVLCNVDPLTGKPIGDIAGTAMHLPADTYHFYSISPAVKLEREASSLLPGLKIDHGSKLSLRTSLLENKKIEYFSTEVPNGKPGIFNLKLDTHTLLTSKITFKLIKGDKIGKMEFIETERPYGDTKLRSIVIKNLSPISYSGHNFKIGNKRLTQVLAEGTNDAIGLSNENITKSTDPGAEYEYYFETELLPCRLLGSNGIPISGATEDDLNSYEGSKLEVINAELRLHLNVAEVGDNKEMNYKMYTLKLPPQNYLRGKRYNYTLRVNLGGILVSSWDTSSNWETIIQ